MLETRKWRITFNHDFSIQNSFFGLWYVFNCIIGINRPQREMGFMFCGIYWLIKELDTYFFYQSERREGKWLIAVTWRHAMPCFMPLMFSNGKLSKQSPKMSAFILFMWTGCFQWTVAHFLSRDHAMVYSL